MLLAAGTIKKDDIIKSLFAYKTLVKLVSTNGNTYLEKPLVEIFADLDREMQPLIAMYANQPVIAI